MATTSTIAMILPNTYKDLAHQASMVIRAINHPIRSKILEFIIAQPGVVVLDICKQFRLEQPVVSGHLSIMRKAGIIKYTAREKFHIYEVNTERLMQVNSAILTLNSNQ